MRLLIIAGICILSISLSNCRISTKEGRDRRVHTSERKVDVPYVSYLQLFGVNYGIERFERAKSASKSPGGQGLIPLTNINYEEAKRLCSASAARICNYREWIWACKAAEAQQSKACSDRSGVLPTGAACSASPNAPSDMVGNAAEWVSGPEGDPVIIGMADCFTFRRVSPQKESPRLGVRCCH